MPAAFNITEIFPEKGVRGIQLAFTDTDDTAVVPDSISWTLTDQPASRAAIPNVINSRQNVAITPAATVVIVLSGDDLALQAAEAGHEFATRILTVAWTFDSATLGNNVSDYTQYRFKIQNLYGVS